MPIYLLTLYSNLVYFIRPFPGGKFGFKSQGVARVITGLQLSKQTQIKNLCH